VFRLLVPLLLPAAATWQGAAAATEGTENVHKYKRKTPWHCSFLDSYPTLQNKGGQQETKAVTQQISSAAVVIRYFSSIASLLP